MTSETLPSNTYSLDGVKEEDKNLVQDVLDLLLHTQKHCKSWFVHPYKTHYEILGSIDKQATDWEIFFDDLELIRQLNIVRIPLISVRMFGEIPQIKVRIIPHSERIVVHATDILRVEKKRKWWGIL